MRKSNMFLFGLCSFICLSGYLSAVGPQIRRIHTANEFSQNITCNCGGDSIANSTFNYAFDYGYNMCSITRHVDGNSWEYGVATPYTDQYVINCNTTFSSESGNYTFTTTYLNTYLSSNTDTMTYDSLGRRIFMQTKSNGVLLYAESVYYGTHSQPDSVIVSVRTNDSRCFVYKYVYTFDGLGRKFRTDCYTRSFGDSNWTFQYFYTYDYIAPYGHMLDLISASYLHRMEMNWIIDATWQFSTMRINYSSGESYDTSWTSTVSDSIIVGFIPDPSWTYKYTFHNDGSLSNYYECKYQPISCVYSFDGTYTWEMQDLDNESFVSPSAQLMKNAPNPFSRHTWVHYKLTQPNHVQIQIFNIKGQRVKNLETAYRSAGAYSLEWNGENDDHQPLPSGLYLIRFQAGTKNEIRKVMKVK